MDEPKCCPSHSPNPHSHSSVPHAQFRCGDDDSSCDNKICMQCAKFRDEAFLDDVDVLLWHCPMCFTALQSQPRGYAAQSAPLGGRQIPAPACQVPRGSLLRASSGGGPCAPSSDQAGPSRGRYARALRNRAVAGGAYAGLKAGCSGGGEGAGSSAVIDLCGSSSSDDEGDYEGEVVRLVGLKREASLDADTENVPSGSSKRVRCEVDRQATERLTSLPMEAASPSRPPLHNAAEGGGGRPSGTPNESSITSAGTTSAIQHTKSGDAPAVVPELPPESPACPADVGVTSTPGGTPAAEAAVTSEATATTAPDAISLVKIMDLRTFLMDAADFASVDRSDVFDFICWCRGRLPRLSQDLRSMGTDVHLADGNDRGLLAELMQSPGIVPGTVKGSAEREVVRGFLADLMRKARELPT